jgi:hypothetical protein
MFFISRDARVSEKNEVIYGLALVFVVLLCGEY